MMLINIWYYKVELLSVYVVRFIHCVFRVFIFLGEHYVRIVTYGSTLTCVSPYDKILFFKSKQKSGTEYLQSGPNFCPQNQKGCKLQIDILQWEHTVSRVFFFQNVTRQLHKPN